MDSRIAFHSGFLIEQPAEMAAVRHEALPTRFNEPQRVGDDSSAWVPISQAALALDDWGVLQGAMLVERLRTVNRQALDVEPHLDRLRAGARSLGIPWPAYLDGLLVNQCVLKNQAAHSGQDFSLVILLTPGRANSARPQPTVILHTTSIQWRTLAEWYRSGQPLMVADARNVPPACWSPNIKTRSRLHYYLADRQAHQQTSSVGDALPGAVMLSLDGYLTETSVANLIVVQGSRLISPPVESVLQGISLTRTLRLAHLLGIEVQYRPVKREMALAADGILLTGTTGCLWCASSLEMRVFNDPTELGVYQQLQAAWTEDIQLDYVRQARDVGA